MLCAVVRSRLALVHIERASENRSTRRRVMIASVVANCGKKEKKMRFFSFYAPPLSCAPKTIGGVDAIEAREWRASAHAARLCAAIARSRRRGRPTTATAMRGDGSLPQKSGRLLLPRALIFGTRERKLECAIAERRHLFVLAFEEARGRVRMSAYVSVKTRCPSRFQFMDARASSASSLTLPVFAAAAAAATSDRRSNKTLSADNDAAAVAAAVAAAAAVAVAAVARENFGQG